MRRVKAAVIGTIAGTALLVSLRVGASATEVADEPVAQADLPAPPTPQAEPSPTPADDRPKPGRRPSPSDDPDESPDETPDPTVSPSKTASPSPTASPTSSPSKPSGAFKGKAVKNKYGTVQVTITLDKGQITDSAGTAPTEGDSGRINKKALPKLREATLKAQSADLDTVSGATYTSKSYRQSLQSAIDASHTNLW